MRKTSHRIRQMDRRGRAKRGPIVFFVAVIVVSASILVITARRPSGVCFTITTKIASSETTQPEPTPFSTKILKIPIHIDGEIEVPGVYHVKDGTLLVELVEAAGGFTDNADRSPFNLADAALVGFPNAGKSTLLSVMSAAKPKIASYPFTTLQPILGVVDVSGARFVLADVPGLIEGASEGAGMGHDFLRHVERARLLLHVLDVSNFDGIEPMDRFVALNRELENYKNLLDSRPQWVVLNKIDLVTEDTVQKLRDDLEALGYRVFAVSGATTEGVTELKQALAAEVLTLPPPELDEIGRLKVYRLDKKYDFSVSEQKGVVSVEGPFIHELMQSTNFSDAESFRHFQKRIVDSGIQDALLDAGVEEGDDVLMDGVLFEFFL
jgi:Obg family GTPase CgtA-like protein